MDRNPTLIESEEDRLCLNPTNRAARDVGESRGASSKDRDVVPCRQPMLDFGSQSFDALAELGAAFGEYGGGCGAKASDPHNILKTRPACTFVRSTREQ